MILAAIAELSTTLNKRYLILYNDVLSHISLYLYMSMYSGDVITDSLYTLHGVYCIMN